MIFGFMSDTIYHDVTDDMCYIHVIRAIEYDDCWQIWAIWYNKYNENRIREHNSWFVNKENLKNWDYGKFGKS